MGLLMSALGGAAEVGLDQMQDQRRAELQEETSKRMADYNNDLAIKRAEAVEKAKEEFRRSEQVRLEQEGQAAAEGGREIRSKREIDTATKRAPSVDRDTMGLIKASLSDAEVEKYYGVKAPTAVSEYDDQIASARQSGHYDTVDGLRKGRKDALDEQKEISRGEREDAKEEGRNERTRLTLESSERKAEKRASGGGGSGGALNAEKLEVTKAREKRLDIQKRIDVVIKQVENRMVKKEDGLAKIRELEAQQDSYQKIIDGGGESTEKVPKATGNEGKSTKPPSIANVKGAPSGSSMGALVSGKGWEIKNSGGKVIGYAKD